MKIISFIEKFGNNEITFIEIDKEFYLQMSDVANALGYKEPRKAASKLFLRNKDELEEYSKSRQIDDSGQLRETRFLSEIGVSIFSMLSKASNSKEFRKWAAITLKERRKNNSLSTLNRINPETQAVLEMTQNLMQSISQGIYQTKEQIVEIDHKITITSKKADQAIEKVERVQDEITTLRNFYISDQEKVKLKKTLKDTMNELANLFMFCADEKKKTSFNRIWCVLRRKYTFSKLEEMNPLFYSRAIEFLSETILWSDKYKRIHPLFFKKNYDKIEPDSFPIR